IKLSLYLRVYSSVFTQMLTPSAQAFYIYTYTLSRSPRKNILTLPFSNLTDLMEAIKETNFSFAGQTGFYRGKVRDVYYFENRLAVLATDRISAFDVVLPRAIPY